MEEIKAISQLFPKCTPAAERKLLAIFAHPDDESLNAGGLLAKAHKENIQTYLLCLSLGEKGIVDPKIRGNKLKQIRKKELLGAARILGIKKVFFGGFPDGELVNKKKEVRRCIGITVGKVKPQMIVTHDPAGGTGHPDHITASWAVKSAVKMGEKQPLLFWSFGMKPKSQIILSKPAYFLKTTFFLPVIKRAYLANQSQRLGKSLPVPLKAWLSLFDREYYQQVDLLEKEKFRYCGFKTRYFRFKPRRESLLFCA